MARCSPARHEKVWRKLRSPTWRKSKGKAGPVGLFHGPGKTGTKLTRQGRKIKARVKAIKLKGHVDRLLHQNRSPGPIGNSIKPLLPVAAWQQWPRPRQWWI